MPTRVKALGAVGLAAVSIGAGLQVRHDLSQNPNVQPRVEFNDPLTWVSAPIASAIEHIKGQEQTPRSNPNGAKDHRS